MNQSQWIKIIEDQKSSGETVKDYCHKHHIGVSTFYKKKAMLHNNDVFTPVIVEDNSDHLIEFIIDKHHISCSRHDLKMILENIL